jgi:beta-glucosidase
MAKLQFPDGFLWGAATSAFQIEGSPLADGGAPSIQHRFAHTPGNTVDGSTGDVAADHYNRYRDDVALMKELGLQAYQFSVPWSRVVPDGHGAVNQKALDFYDSLVDALLEAGIKPVPVLYVWELPGAAQDRGGWANRDCADWFAEFSAAAFERLGDRATHWLTICEPQSVAHFGYVLGELAPCIKDVYAGMKAAHHLLLGQGIPGQRRDRRDRQLPRAHGHPARLRQRGGSRRRRAHERVREHALPRRDRAWRVSARDGRALRLRLARGP